MTAVAQIDNKCASHVDGNSVFRNLFSTTLENAVASRLPMIPATAPRMRNSTEKMRAISGRVDPRVFRKKHLTK